MIKNYKQFNESLRDKLVGPSDEEVLNNFKDLSPDELLRKSCEIGFFKGLEVALKNGIKYGMIDAEYVLIKSVEFDFLEGVDFALEKGADIHWDSDCALRISLDNNDDVMKKYLLDRGADLHVAEEYRTKMIEEWEERCRSLKKTNESLKDKLVGPTDEEVLNNFKNLSPRELLEKSSEIGFIKGVEIALERGADIHKRDDYPLRYAAQNGHMELVKYLLGIGADIHCSCDSPLRYAAQNGHTDIVKLLLDRGANIHSSNDYSLRWASKFGNTETVKLLLDRGADVHVDNDRPLKNAIEYGHTETSELLKQYMKND